MNIKTFQMLLLFVFAMVNAMSQQLLSDEQAVEMALKNNLMVQSGEFQVASQKQMKNTALDFGKTNIVWLHGQFNSILNDNNYTISQTIPFPTTIASRSKLQTAQIAHSEAALTMSKNELVKRVRTTYQQLVYTKALNQELVIQDSLFFSFARAAAIRHRVGEGTMLEKSTAEMQSKEIRNQLRQNESDISIYHRQLQILLNTTDEISPTGEMGRIATAAESLSTAFNPQLQMLKHETAIADRLKREEKNKLLPDIMIGYFSQSLIGFQRINNNDVFFDKSDRFTGFELGLSIPLWFVPQQSRTKAAALNQEASIKKYEFYQNQIEGDLQRAQLELAKYENSLLFYESDANDNAALLLHQAQRSLEEGEVGYLEFFQAVNQARAIRLDYLKTLYQYNQASIELDYLVGKY